ncbi:hypothetical protein Q8A67_016971 [Cirrhinus molitorella]|uniref:Uncharacterized protein n=1 Tax=Cirrhinus molitorella TaxID=172907 RepID=A0AA88PGY3_9TELE|nr:hypothetical protein Q8A67_016971 [Cirrhinus molitorella]
MSQNGQQQVCVFVQHLFRQVLQKLCPHGVVTGSVNTSRQMEHWSSSFSKLLEDAMTEKTNIDNISSTLLKSDEEDFLLGSARRFPYQQTVPFPAAIRTCRKRANFPKRARRCYKCCAVTVTRAALRCAPLTVTASALYAWAPPTLKLRSQSLASLRSWVALFSERDPASRALPHSSSQEPVRKKAAGQRASALGYERAHTGSTPARLALTTERESG